MKKLCALAVACIAIVQAAEGIAQEQQSFKTVIGKSYEIKNVTFARGEATDNREIFVVTLQKDKSVAVCYFAAPNWINLSHRRARGFQALRRALTSPLVRC